jgi:hypothetical protein
MIDKVENTDNSDWKVVHFMPRPEFDVEFGFKSEKKTGSEISGDTHSFLKIAGNKFLLALLRWHGQWKGSGGGFIKGCVIGGKLL